MSSAPPTGPVRRVRITSPRREARRRAAHRPATQELAEQTGLGEVYLSALLRAQLRLSLAILLGVGAVVLGLPAMFLLLPATRHLEVGPIPLPWLAIGVFPNNSPWPTRPDCALWGSTDVWFALPGMPNAADVSLFDIVTSRPDPRSAAGVSKSQS